MKHLILKISGMSCDHCKAAVTGALQILPSMQNLSVDVATGNASFTYDPSILELRVIVNAIEDLGYDVLAPVPE